MVQPVGGGAQWEGSGCWVCVFALDSFTCLTWFPWYWGSVSGLQISPSPLVVFKFWIFVVDFFLELQTWRRSCLFAICLWVLLVRMRLLCYFQLSPTCGWQLCQHLQFSPDPSFSQISHQQILLVQLSKHIASQHLHFHHPGLVQHHLYRFLQWPLCLWHPQHSGQSGAVKLNVSLYPFFG